MFWLTALWLLLWGEVSVANVVGGLAVAVGVLTVARLDRASLRSARFRPVWAVVYFGDLLWQLVLANVRLAVEIMTPRDRTHTAIIAVPIRCGSDAVVNLVANSITLTPGTITVDVRRPESTISGDVGDTDTDCSAVLYVHCIYGEDIDALRRSVLRLQSSALRAFGSDGDRRLADVAEDVANETIADTDAAVEADTTVADASATSVVRSPPPDTGSDTGDTR